MAYYRSFEVDISSLEKYYSDIETTLYAVVSVVSASSCTEENMTWESDRVLRFLAKESKIQDKSATLTIRLRSRRTFMIDEAIGHVGPVPLKELLDHSFQNDIKYCYEGSVVFPVLRSRDDKPIGNLGFSYRFSEPSRDDDSIITNSDEEEDEDEDENEHGDYDYDYDYDD